MPLTESEIKQLAEIRKQEYIYVFIESKPCWLLVDHAICSLSDLMSSANTDTWLAYQSGKLIIKDKNQQPVLPRVKQDWKRLEPLHVTRRKNPRKNKPRPRPQLNGLPLAFHVEED